MAVTNTGSIVIGHVPRAISALCSIFILRRGKITFQITEDQSYSNDLPQGGLELPCCFTFSTSNANQLAKVWELLKISPLIKHSRSGQTNNEPVEKKRLKQTLYRVYTHDTRVFTR